jgi:hypothetical protein
MSQELHYTSVPRGLKPGSRGFGAVATTAGLPAALADRLESLSGYQAVYPPGDPSEALNPIVLAHVRLIVGDQVLDVLSRIGPAGLDYSGRPNKYAHHVVLAPDERPEGGPAWLLSQPGFLEAAWEGEPRILAEGRRPPQGDQPAGRASTWQALTGDGGWAGALAESFLADPRRPVFLVYRPGMRLLPLLAEAIALLPVSRRWDVEFSTYFLSMPQGVSCTWRGVLDGSPEAHDARRLPHAMVLELCRPLGRARGGALVHLARTGELREPSSTTSIPHLARTRGQASSAPAPRAGSSAPTARPAARAGPEPNQVPQVRIVSTPSLRADEHPTQNQRRTTRSAILVAACLVLLITSGLLWSPTIRSRLGSQRAASPPVAQPGVNRASIPETGPAEVKEAAKGVVDTATLSRTEPRSLPLARKTEGAGGDPGAAKLPVRSPQPVAKVQHSPDPPMPPAFTLPDVPTSLLGSSRDRQRGEISLSEEVGDRFEILNAPEFQVVPASTKSTWEIATRTDSVIGGRFTLAQLSHTKPGTWSFDWTKVAKNHSATVAALRDAVLKFETRDGRSILALLRGVRRHDPDPLPIWENQPVLYERLDDRHKSIPWTPHPEDLAGTHWRLRIRRWRLVIERPGAEGREPVRRVIEPASAVVGKKEDGNGRVPLEQDLVPGVAFKVKIDTENPEMIAVRVVPDRDQVRAGRAERAARLKELKANTPADRQGREQDPIPFRRSRLQELPQSGGPQEDEVKTLKKEISDLEAIHAIGQVEDLLTNPARTQLSVVISLDVAGSAPVDVARIGEFARPD